MTLTCRTSCLPSVARLRRGSIPAIWPVTAHSDDDGRLCVGERTPDRYRRRVRHTPTYVIDEADFRSRARRYRAALRRYRGVYAGKSLLTIAVARWAHEEGLGIDVCSAGELAIAMAGGVEKARIVMHGNAKSQDELRAAVPIRGRAHRAGFDHRDHRPRRSGARDGSGC